MVAFALTATAATALAPVVVSPATSFRGLLVFPVPVLLSVGLCGSFVILAIGVTFVLLSPRGLLVSVVRIAVTISLRWFLVSAIGVTLAIVILLRGSLHSFSGRLVRWRGSSGVTRA